MKKTYLNPTTTVVNIELATMIAGSNDPQGFNSTLGNTDTNGDAALSRQSNFSVWGNDEEEY